MRSVSATVLLILLTACAAQPEADAVCTEPRPQVCTMEFRPTCAVLSSGGSKEFASPCTACADKTVTGYVDGACSE